MYQLKIIIIAAILGYVFNEICRLNPNNNYYSVPRWYFKGNDQTKWFNIPHEQFKHGFSLTWENCNLANINISLNPRSTQHLCYKQDIFVHIKSSIIPVETIDIGEICDGHFYICLILNNVQITSFNLIFDVQYVDDKSVIDLDLDNNFVNDLRHNIWPKADVIKSLSLRNNSIRNIRVTSFSSLVNLEILDLSSNYLHSLNSKIFSNIQKLRDLRINDNRFKRIFVDYAFFKILPQHYKFIETNFVYDKDNNDNNSLINLNYFPDRPTGDFIKSVPVIRHELFHDIKVGRVRHLNLKSLQIDVINQGAFLKFKTLKSLDLSHNHLSQLQNGDLDGLYDLSQLSLDYNRIKIIQNDVFNHFKNLIHLSLSHNLLTNLNPKILVPLTQLISLDISHNELSFDFSHNYDLFLNQSNLKTLNLSFNQINEINSELLRPLSNLNELNLDQSLLIDQNFDSKEILKPLRNLNRINYENNEFTITYHLNLGQLCYYYPIKSFGWKDVRKLAVADYQSKYDDLLKKVDSVLMDYAQYYAFYTDRLMYLSILQLILLICFVTFSIFFPNHFKIFQYRV